MNNKEKAPKKKGLTRSELLAMIDLKLENQGCKKEVIENFHRLNMKALKHLLEN
jgi:hypothetical protein|tara:strand:- start:269 stop:430 length:162 start_codon:yes stop_codon:yes gene_type:complete